MENKRLKSLVDSAAYTYHKFRIRGSYWYVTGVGFVFLIGQIFSRFEYLVNFFDSLSDTSENQFFRIFFKFLAIYFEFQAPSWLIWLVAIFLVMNYFLRVEEIKRFLPNEKMESDLESLKTTSQATLALIQDSHPLQLQFHVDRKEEVELSKVLEAKSILLLTGISFSGKSEIAKNIISKLKGYRIFKGGDVAETSRELSRSSKTPIACILEDPFGHNINPESLNNWRRVHDLLHDFNTTNKLIITTRVEVLRGMNNESDVSKLSIEGSAWYDVTNEDRDFALNYWNQLGERKKIDLTVVEKIKQFLTKCAENELLQPGHLNHLSNIDSASLLNKSTSELCYIAKADARDIANQILIENKSLMRTFIALNLSCNTITSVSLNELSVILGDTDEQPGFSQKFDREDVFSDDPESDPGKIKLPTYLNAQPLSSSYIEAIGTLQGRGYIGLDEDRVSFTHPTYFDASRYCCLADRLDVKTTVIDLCKKSITVLDHRNVFNCLVQAEFLYTNAKSSEFKEKVCEIIFESSERSIFPAVRDKALIILLGSITSVSEEIKRRIFRKLELPFADDHIYWHGTTPFINDYASNWMSRFKETQLSEEALTSVLSKLNGKEEVSPLEVWNLINYYLENRTSPSSDIVISRILSVSEGFIRSAAAYLILRYSFPSREILHRVFKDDHPSVLFEGVKGAIQGFYNYSSDQKREILPLLKKAFENHFVIMRANNLITTFGIDYGSESIDWSIYSDDQQREIWGIWAELFPIFLHYYPESLSVYNSGRFSATLDKASKFVTPEQGIAISFEYFKWIDKLLLRTLPDTHEMSILSFLFQTNPDYSEDRIELLRMIFAHDDSNFVTYCSSWVGGFWELLTTAEKMVVYNLLDSPRKDLRWIKASIITQINVPVDLQTVILGTEFALSDSPEHIIKMMNQDLLKDCLDVFNREFYPFDSIGIGHGDVTQWYKIMQWILLNKWPVGFETSIKNLVYAGVNGTTQHWDGEALKIWSAVCDDPSNFEVATKWMIIATSTCSCNLTVANDFWTILSESYHKKGRTGELLEKVRENLEALQHHDPEDFTRIMNKKFLNKLINVLPLDREILTFYTAKGWSNETVTEEFVNSSVERILEVSSMHEVRLHLSLQCVRNLNNKYSVKFPLLSKLMQIANQLEQRGKIAVEKFERTVKAPNWVSLHEQISNKL